MHTISSKHQAVAVIIGVIPVVSGELFVGHAGISRAKPRQLLRRYGGRPVTTTYRGDRGRILRADRHGVGTVDHRWCCSVPTTQQRGQYFATTARQ